MSIPLVDELLGKARRVGSAEEGPVDDIGAQALSDHDEVFKVVSVASRREEDMDKLEVLDLEGELKTEDISDTDECETNELKLRGIKKIKFLKEKEKKNWRSGLQSAVLDWSNGKFLNVRKCAKFHGIKYMTLYGHLSYRQGQIEGRGRKLSVLTPEEEQRVVQHILYWAAIGYGESWKTVRRLLQQVLIEIKAANPQRVTGLEKQGQLPSTSWVSRFSQRHNLVLRKCSIISEGRAIISPHDVSLWFEDVGNFLASKPDLLEALSDPRRVYNQDETAIEHGVGNQWVLAMKGEKQVYAVSSSTREHTTISFTVNAAGEVVTPRAIFSGV